MTQVARSIKAHQGLGLAVSQNCVLARVSEGKFLYKKGVESGKLPVRYTLKKRRKGSTISINIQV